MTSDMTTYAFGLKEWYAKPRMIDLTYVDSTLFALLKKVEKFEGSAIPVSMLHTTPQGVGAGFSQAQARSLLTNSSGVRLSVTPVLDYSIAVISGSLIRRTKTDMGAFLKGATCETDGAITALKSSIAQKLYRSGYGSLGVIGSTSTSSFVMSNISDALNFAIGMEIVFADTEGADTLHDSGDSVAVTGVDTSTGTITIDDTVASISGLAAGDYVFRKSDRQDSATPARLAIAGLEAWNPQTAPSASESYFGIDRSVYPSRLAGHRKDMAGSPLEEVLIQASILAGVEGGKVDHVFMNFVRWAQLQQAFQARGVLNLDEVKVTPRVGFPSINVVGPSGVVKVMADANCPNNRVHGVKLSSLALYSAGPAVQVLDEDGMTLRAISNSDAYEVRYGFEGNLICDEPRSLVNIAV